MTEVYTFIFHANSQETNYVSYVHVNLKGVLLTKIFAMLGILPMAPLIFTIGTTGIYDDH